MVGKNERKSGIIYTVSVICLLFTAYSSQADDDISLKLYATTATQIVLSWEVDSSESIENFEIQRSKNLSFTSPTNITIDSHERYYSDTGYDPNNKLRFSSTQLEWGVNYYYRIRIHYTSDYSDYSETVRGAIGEPLRGVTHDLWADIVLGQPDFAQNTHGKTAIDSINIGGGIYIDTDSTPQRAYFVDVNHNRILGFSDIDARPLVPSIVIGQPDFNSSAPNGEATAQCYPRTKPPDASTLNLSGQTLISVAESVHFNQLAADEDHNLYVSDVANNRVLKYNDPFNTDTIADEVWGQPDFSTGTANNGGVSNHSLDLVIGHNGLSTAIAPDGFLWIGDPGNHRVLHFPKNISGVIEKNADLVLGQNNFTTVTVTSVTTELNKLYYPRGLSVADDGTLYVCDTVETSEEHSRVLVFEPPFSNGMYATKLLAHYPTVQRPYYSHIDPQGRGLWVHNNYGAKAYVSLLDINTGAELKRIDLNQSRSLGVDNSGNIYVQILDEGIYKYNEPDYNTNSFLFTDKVNYTGQDFGHLRGMTTFGSQFIVADGERMLIYENFRTLESYQHADDVWGQVDFESNNGYDIEKMGYPKIDPIYRLWVSGLFRRGGSKPFGFLAFSYPLTHDSVPVKEVWNTFDLVDYSGTITIGIPWEWEAFDFANWGDQLWVTDWINSRAIRINNINGNNDPTRDPYVDVVLGQMDSTSTERNQGAGANNPGPNTLDIPKSLTVDSEENIYICDNSGEGGSNQRILIFDAELFPDDLTSVLYGINASKVIGTDGSFTVIGCVDETCCPTHCSFHPQGYMVVTPGVYNHNSIRYPTFFLDPYNYNRPQMAFGDFMSNPLYTHIDEEGNIYIGDYNWSRILIYKMPFDVPGLSGIDFWQLFH